MLAELADRVAFVTGGSGGVGAAVALEPARRGAAIALTCCRHREPAQATASTIAESSGRAVVLARDLTDTDHTRLAFGRWGERRTQQVIGGAPLQRIARPAEGTRMVSVRASDDGAYITGKVIQVDG